MGLVFTFKFKEKKVSSPSISNIVAKGVKGIVVRQNDTYYVLYENDLFPITANSFNCKGKKIIYLRDNKTNRYCKIIRDISNRPSCPKQYIPFKEKLYVKGDIVKVIDKSYFRVIASYNPSSKEEFDEAMEEFDKLNNNE